MFSPRILTNLEAWYLWPPGPNSLVINENKLQSHKDMQDLTRTTMLLVCKCVHVHFFPYKVRLCHFHYNRKIWKTNNANSLQYYDYDIVDYKKHLLICKINCTKVY